MFYTLKNVTETYGMLHIAFGTACMNQASVFEWHMRFKEGRKSVRDGVGGVRKSIHESWLAKGLGLGLGLLCCGFKGDQEEIPSSNRVSGISTRTIHHSTTPSFSQTIWARWASRQFPTLPIVQTLLPVTFAYSLSSQAVGMRQLMRWKRLTKVIDTLTHVDLHGAFQKLLERYNECIASGGDYSEEN